PRVSPRATLFPYTTLFRSLLEELRHVHDQVADHRQSRQRTDRDVVGKLGELGDAGELVLAVNVHRIRPADAFAARAAERERVVQDRKSTRLNSSHRTTSYA